MEAIARRYPDRQVNVVWDNLNIHCDGKDERWTRFNQRHGNRFHFVYTPKHASWVNQIEIWFSILHRRVLKHGSFAGVPELREAVLGFIRFWNLKPLPFRWTFTGDFAQPSIKRAS
jgi:transposase